MIRILLSLCLVMIIAGARGQETQLPSRLRVSADAHGLENRAGKPFFWLSDAAYDMFHRLSFEEIKWYLKDRQSKGFTVIQAAILPGGTDLQGLNRYGAAPLVDANPNTPNERYFELVDTTVQMAARRNLYMGLVPAMGDKVAEGWGKGPAVFTSRNAYNYGYWLGKRYKEQENIIWILGGASPAQQEKADWKPVWRAMARGIQEGTGYQALITYLPEPGEKGSAGSLHTESWLNLNLVNNGHEASPQPVWDWVERDYRLPSSKPVVMANASFEDHPVQGSGAATSERKAHFTDYDFRKQAYRSVFKGACGVGYGNYAVSRFIGSEGVGEMGFYWKDGLQQPGAFSAGYIKKVMECRPWTTRVQDPGLVVEGQEEGENHITAIRGSNNDFAMVYLPVGKTIQVNTSFMKSDDIKIWWYDARIGLLVRGKSEYRRGLITLTPPTLGPGQDWVLVLDDPEYQYRPPGDWIEGKEVDMKIFDEIEQEG